MSTATARLLADALQLPEKDRADLAAELLASLTPATHAEGRTEDEWLVEIERRARAAIAGSPGIPWDEARREIERRVAQAKR
jgi:hypothetical protein